VLQNKVESELRLPGLELKTLEQGSPAAKFDLTLSVDECDDGLSLSWRYAADLFETASIQRMADRFEVLLNGITKNPEGSIDTLPLLTEAETNQLIEWNQTAEKYPKDKTLVDLFEEQVKQNPNNTAVIFKKQRITYQELNEKANQLAHILIKQGVRADTLVGICVERSLEMIIGLLGVLKSGGAYVPLDPDYPAERLRFMLENSGTKILLSQTSLRDHLTEFSGKTVNLDLKENLEAYPVHNPERRSAPKNLAYVIYTSGSTGTPKGVMIEHRHVANLLHAYEGTTSHPYNFNSLAVSPFSFDVAVWEYFSALCFGGALHILLREKLLDPEILAQYIRTQNIHSAYIPPALLDKLRNHLDSLQWSLQRLLVGVESIPQGLLQKYQDLSGEHIFHIINGYGPTETSICSSFYAFLKTTGADINTPIGTPIANTRIYILNKNNQIQPIGVPGELCIAGDGLARGYLNRLELTEEK
ncbi:MAG: amino acid adenylation domain-containing protein, partial [Candidatus Electrothrix sp. AR4]|nr:amino acid adenylation domain-containing protein [Candidatus Electrothrix sp. AR4]